MQSKDWIHFQELYTYCTLTHIHRTTLCTFHIIVWLVWAGYRMIFFFLPENYPWKIADFICTVYSYTYFISQGIPLNITSFNNTVGLDVEGVVALRTVVIARLAHNPSSLVTLDLQCCAFLMFTLSVELYNLPCVQ